MLNHEVLLDIDSFRVTWVDTKWEDNVFMKAKHKLLEAIEKRNKESYHTEGDIRAYKDALKALYYLISIEKSGGVK